MHDHRRRARARWALSFEYYNHEVPIYLSDSNNTDARRAIAMMITTTVEAAESKLLNIELRCTGLPSRLRLLLLKNVMESSLH